MVKRRVRSHKMTQIPNMMSEVAPKYDHNHIAYFFMKTLGNFIQEKLDFYPIFQFFMPQL